MSLGALVQLTVYCSQADATWAKAMGVREMATADGLQPGEQIAIAGNISGVMRIAQEFEVSSTQVHLYQSHLPVASGRRDRD